MRDFYHDLLGLAVLDAGADHLTLAGGATPITFVPAEKSSAPFYHFAFNIPENKILAALVRQKEHTPIIPAPESLRDPDLPEEIVHYRHWNAHSVFFWDPAGNLVEYIARHDLRNAAPGPFTPDDMLYASEIAWIVDDVDTLAAEIAATFELEQYRGGGPSFRALGDEHGLLLAMRRGRELGFGQAKPADVFPTWARVRGPRGAVHRPEGYPYEIEAG